MPKQRHRDCVYRSVRKLDGRPTTAYCTAAPSGPVWPQCTYCKDDQPGRPFKKPKPPMRKP